jgi:hypothetical protein
VDSRLRLWPLLVKPWPKEKIYPLTPKNGIEKDKTEEKENDHKKVGAFSACGKFPFPVGNDGANDQDRPDDQKIIIKQFIPLLLALSVQNKDLYTSALDLDASLNGLSEENGPDKMHNLGLSWFLQII